MNAHGEIAETQRDEVDQVDAVALAEQIASIKKLAAQLGSDADKLLVEVDRLVRSESRSRRALVAVRTGLVELAGKADILASRASSCPALRTTGESA